MALLLNFYSSLVNRDIANEFNCLLYNYVYSKKFVLTYITFYSFCKRHCRDCRTLRRNENDANNSAIAINSRLLQTHSIGIFLRNLITTAIL